MSDFRVWTQNFIQRDITLYMQKKISVSLKIDTDGLCVRSRKKIVKIEIFQVSSRNLDDEKDFYSLSEAWKNIISGIWPSSTEVPLLLPAA